MLIKHLDLARFRKGFEGEAETGLEGEHAVVNIGKGSLVVFERLKVLKEYLELVVIFGVEVGQGLPLLDHSLFLQLKGEQVMSVDLPFFFLTSSLKKVPSLEVF